MHNVLDRRNYHCACTAVGPAGVAKVDYISTARGRKANGTQKWSSWLATYTGHKSFDGNQTMDAQKHSIAWTSPPGTLDTPVNTIFNAQRNRATQQSAQLFRKRVGTLCRRQHRCAIVAFDSRSWCPYGRSDTYFHRRLNPLTPERAIGIALCLGAHARPIQKRKPYWTYYTHMMVNSSSLVYIRYLTSCPSISHYHNVLGRCPTQRPESSQDYDRGHSSLFDSRDEVYAHAQQPMQGVHRLELPSASRTKASARFAFVCTRPSVAIEDERPTVGTDKGQSSKPLLLKTELVVPEQRFVSVEIKARFRLHPDSQSGIQLPVLCTGTTVLCLMAPDQGR